MDVKTLGQEGNSPDLILRSLKYKKLIKILELLKLLRDRLRSSHSLKKS